MSPDIRPVAATDRPDWNLLYQAYAKFYNVPQTDAMRDTLWSWLMDEATAVHGLVAEHNGGLVGLAHFRPFKRPLSASTGGFLDDLFVTPEARGLKLADALIASVQDYGRANGWTVIRWITAEDNYRARGVYDRLAKKTAWATYDLTV
jgi:GNAT superfamily N-acetyltransferase